MIRRLATHGNLFFRLQIASDLHLDINSTKTNYDEIIKPSAPYLALAGDIAELKNSHILMPFLKNVCTKFKKVFYIMGNHEFYYSKKFNKETSKKTFWKNCV